MDDVLVHFRDLCDNPVAWALLVAATLKAVVSVVHFVRCPFIHGAARLTPEDARAALQRRTLHDARFLAGMTAAMGLTIGGLYAMRAPETATLALGMVVVGVFLLLVAPSRLWIQDGMLRVAAARAAGGEALAFAADRLRAAHVERIAIEIGFAAAFGAMMWAFA